ncbi:MAG: amino acid ABC transporter permease, partial [Pseudomonas sp.]|nr:amino acid ABC transporter permease [Pseudomonas sp.]
MAKQKKAQWPWHVLTGVILLGLAGSLWFASSLISYEWHWNRLPQYFAYQAEVPQRAEDYGQVAALTAHGSLTEVTLRSSAAVEQLLTVDSD